jgi:Rps23 Pro-64 3,4-dihydroxylase Tpa1-like proline 4-hydroxylase
MKKDIDPNKVSNFKNIKVNYQHHSTFCMKTKPNNLYFKGELKKITLEAREHLCTEQLKKNDPALYYSMMGRKLPKKYLKKENVQIAPVNAFVPPQLKFSITEHDILEKKEAINKKIKQEKVFKAQQEKNKEKQRLAYNEATFYKQQKLVHWCNAHDQGNYVSIHSDKFKSREKKYIYY